MRIVHAPRDEQSMTPSEIFELGNLPSFLGHDEPPVRLDAQRRIVGRPGVGEVLVQDRTKGAATGLRLLVQLVGLEDHHLDDGFLIAPAGLFVSVRLHDCLVLPALLDVCSSGRAAVLSWF